MDWRNNGNPGDNHLITADNEDVRLEHATPGRKWNIAVPGSRVSAC